MNKETPEIDTRKLRQACSNCSLQELCLPVGLSVDELSLIDRLVQSRKRIPKGSALYHHGDTFKSLFAVRSGFFKTFIIMEDGREQVTGFQMTGELLGMDAISTESHSCEAIAMEDSEVCEIPYESLESLATELPSLQRHFHRTMSREIVRDQGLLLLLGSMRAEERLATFLINLSDRFAARGFSRNEFVLRMTREDIGSYLGLKLETVSRALSKMNAEGVIAVQGKTITIENPEGLKALTCQS